MERAVISQTDILKQSKTSEYDLIAVGSGHNGLVAAAYLAKAGMLVLERNSWFGGGVVTREGKVFGTMPMTARLTPQELRAGLKLLSFQDVVFVLTMPFRKATIVKGKRAS